MKKTILALLISVLALNINAQNGNNDPCSDLIKSYNTAVTNASQIDPVFGVCHNSVSSLEINAQSNGKGNGNNPWNSNGYQSSSNGQGAQVGFSVRLSGNKGFINIYFNRVNNSWVFQHVQGAFPNYCSKTVAANCSEAYVVSNTCL